MRPDESNSFDVLAGEASRGPMTKALTTVAVLQRVEQGRLGLDDEVAAIAPAFGGDARPSRRSRAAGRLGGG